MTLQQVLRLVSGWCCNTYRGPAAALSACRFKAEALLQDYMGLGLPYFWRRSSTCTNMGSIAVLPLQDVLGFLDLQDIVGSFMRTLDLPRLRSQSLAQCMADLEAAGRDFSARQLAGLEELGEAALMCPLLSNVLRQPLPVLPGGLAAAQPQQVAPGDIAA